MVFNRFWRADPARARTSGGTGLGLAISLEDARLHAGWLQAWGAPGEGSCFRLTLPTQRPDPDRAVPAAARTGLAGRTRRAARHRGRAGTVSRLRVLVAAAMLAAWSLPGFGACTGLPARQRGPGRPQGRRAGGRAGPRHRPTASARSVHGSRRPRVHPSGCGLPGGRQPGAGRQVLPGPSSVDRWRPTSLVTVFDRDASLVATAVSPTQVKVSTQAVAVVDGGGRYRELAPQTPVEAMFDLVQVQGQWRVSLPESGFGIWVNTDDFGLLFDAYAVTFPAVARAPPGPRRALVRDRTALGDRIGARPAWGDPGVPQRRRGDRSPGRAPSSPWTPCAVQDQIATVVLSSAANTSDVQRRRAMWAQFAATMTQVPGVSGVSLEVSGHRADRRPGCPRRRHLSRPGRVQPGGPDDTTRSGLLRVGERLARVDLTPAGRRSTLNRAFPLGRPDGPSCRASPPATPGWPCPPTVRTSRP